MSEDRTQLLGQLCDLLEQHGVVAVALTYEGSGDSGQIDEVEECVDDGSASNGGHIDFHHAERADSQDKLETKITSPAWYEIKYRDTPAEVKLATLVEHVGYKFLPFGFENGSGGEGNVLLSVAKRQLALNEATRVGDWERSLYEAPKPIKPQRTMANQKSVRKVKK